MNEASPAQDDVLAVLALNILCGNLKPEQWRGIRRVDAEETAVLDKFNDLRRYGFGKIEVSVINHSLETVHKEEIYKRRDLLKEESGS